MAPPSVTGPSALDEFPERVLFTMLRVPKKLLMAPPRGAVLPAIVLLLIVTSLPLLKIAPPPRPRAVLPAIVQSLIARVVLAATEIAPPIAFGLPLVIESPEIVTLMD